MPPRNTLNGSLGFSGRMAESPSTSSFVYFGKGSTYLRRMTSHRGKYHRKTYPISDSFVIVTIDRKLGMLDDGEELLLTFWADNQVQIRTYMLKGNKFTLKSNAGFGSVGSRVSDFIRLNNGSILLACHEPSSSNSDVSVVFAYRNLSGIWSTVSATYHNLSEGTALANGAMAQDQTGGVWYFGHRDSNHSMAAIHLSEDGYSVGVDFIRDVFIGKEGDFTPAGELPYLIANHYTNGILLAYQNKNTRLYSIKPFVKGANISVINVLPDGTKTLLHTTTDYTERIKPFGLSAIGDDFWLIYRPIDEISLASIDFYRVNPGGRQFLGQGGSDFCFSSAYFVFENTPSSIEVKKL